jgi:hypothetical protein
MGKAESRSSEMQIDNFLPEQKVEFRKCHNGSSIDWGVRKREEVNDLRE